MKYDIKKFKQIDDLEDGGNNIIFLRFIELPNLSISK